MSNQIEVERVRLLGDALPPEAVEVGPADRPRGIQPRPEQVASQLALVGDDPVGEDVGKLAEGAGTRAEHRCVERQGQQRAPGVQHVPEGEHHEVGGTEQPADLRGGNLLQSQFDTGVRGGSGCDVRSELGFVAASSHQQSGIRVGQRREGCAQLEYSLVRLHPAEEEHQALVVPEFQGTTRRVPLDVGVGLAVVAMRHDDVRDPGQPGMGADRRISGGRRETDPAVQQGEESLPPEGFRARVTTEVGAKVVSGPHDPGAAPPQPTEHEEGLQRSVDGGPTTPFVERALGPVNVGDVNVAAPDPVELKLPDVDSAGDERVVEQGVVGVGTPVGKGRSREDAHATQSRASLQRVGVVIVAYASASTLTTCLRALPVDDLHGVVVVDNASPDDSATIAATVPGVQVVRLPDNRGFGGGCNAGVAALGDAELVLFLNPDAVIEQDQLRLLIDHLDQHERCAVAAPRLYRQGQPLSSAGGDAGLATELRTVVPTQLARLFPERRLPPSYAVTGPVGYVEGACFLVRRQALEQVGGFDEAFFLFFEELDLARRLRRQGRTVDLVAAAGAEHLRAVSRKTLADGGRSHLLASTVIYLQRRGAWRARAFLAIAPVCWSLRARLGGLDARRAAAMTQALKEMPR